MTMADELLKLHTLHQQGALTDEEFAAAKKRVFDGEPAAEPPKYVRPPQSSMKLFQRSTTDRWIGGVCGGLADLTDVPAWTWRILFVLTALIHGIGLIVYILLWIFVPVQNPALPAPAPTPPAPPATPPSPGQ